MDQPKIFEDIRTALQGTIVLPTPRVSRETIISVLQTHTDLIMGIRKDHNALASQFSELEEQTKSNKKAIRVLESEQSAMKKDIESLYRLCDEFRKEMEELSQKVAELYVLKRQMADQQLFVDTLSNKFYKFHTEVVEYMEFTTSKMAEVQKLCDETQFQLKEMKEYVDHFADNLVLNSSQITVDTYAGFSSKPIPLTEALRMCTNNFGEMSTVTTRQSEQIQKLFASLDSKAPDSILFNITTLEKKVSTIELHIQKEEEQGLGALRKTCEQLSVQMQSITVELADKIDRESVGLIVHEKYEEIVRYLHDALQSSLEDENNFKEKADEIQEMVILLSNSKADRTEIANMQEVMVKSEALLKKVGAQANLKEKIKDFVPRKELEAALALKVDRTDFEQQLQSAMANTRRARKLSSLATGLQPVIDNALIDGVMFRDDDSIGGPSPNAAGSGRLGGMVGGQAGISPMSIAVNRGSTPPMMPPAQGNAANAFRSNVAAASSSSSSDARAFSIDGAMQPPPRQVVPVPVIALGMGMTGGGNSGKHQQMTADFNSYLKGKNKGKEMLSTSLPSAEIPGGFRRATEGGRSGGISPDLLRPRSGGGNAAAAGYGTSEFPYLDGDGGAGGDHLAYLQGPVMGGGFNVKAKHVQKGQLGGTSVAVDDIEGKGLMVKGKDGQMYYQDLTGQR